MKRKSLILFMTLILGLPWMAMAQETTEPEGTRATLTINNASDWDTFCDAIDNMGSSNPYTTVTLAADITVTRMVPGNCWASTGKRFGGTFDGGGHTITFNYTATSDFTGLFRYTYGATIKNLRLEGTIISSQPNTASLIGMSQSTTNIENVVSNVTINSTATGVAGMVAGASNSIYFRGCAFTGVLNGTSSEQNGGFVGRQWNNGTHTYTNCLFAPTSVSSSLTNGATFDPYTSSQSNCYYTQTFGTVQGTQAYKVTLAANPIEGGTVDGGTPTTSYSLLKAYSNGLLCGGIYYANGSVSLKANANEGYTFSKWNDNNTDNPRSITVNGNASYTATFTEGGSGGGGSSSGGCEDFESVTAVSSASTVGNMPDDWDYIYTGSSAGYSPKVYNGSSYKPSEPLASVIGSNRLMMIAGTSDTYGENTYVILPSYKNVTGISFNAWREHASNGTLYFGYITNANDASTFHQLYQLTTVIYSSANESNASFSYDNLSIPSGARLAFRWNHSSSWYSAFIDNVCVTTAPEEISIGNDASTGSGYYLPVNMYYNNSMTQQIFTADEIGTAGTIKSISFNCTAIGSSSNAKTVKVYMKHTDKETFRSNTDVVRMDAADVVVASFTLLPTATGWVKMTLDTPFEYDGQSNLLICCYDHSYQYPGFEYQFQTTATSGYTSITYYSDTNYDYNPTNPATGGNMSYYQYRNNLKMEIVPPAVTCPKPSDLTLDAVGESSATISWTSDGASFEYVYGTTGFTPDWSGTTYTTSNTSAQLTNLTASTGYDFYVRTICGTDDYTNPAQLSFYTECGTITTFPWSEDFEGYNSGDFSNPCWVNEHIEGSGTSVFQVSSSNNQTGSTHTLQLPDMSSGTMTKLVLPKMTIPSSGTYAFSIDVYRNNSTSNYGEGIRVYASTNGNIEGATELGFISRSYTTADATHGIPAESASGWYTYTLPIPITGTCYIILRGESKFGSSTYMDNFGVGSAFTISATANPTEGGTVSGAGAYTGGTTCTLTATANRGYDFENWTKNGVEVSTDASFSFTVSEDAAYVANFTALTAYEITATTNDATMGTVTGAGTYYEGETCTLEASTTNGNVFINWTKDGNEVATDAIYSFTVSEDADFVANFAECGFYEDFEACDGGVYSTAADNMPSGWYAYTTGTGTNIVKPHVCNSGLYYYPANGGSHAVNLESGTNASSNKAYVVLPANESGQPYMRISFWYRQESTTNGNGTLKVGYVTEQSATGCNNFLSITSITPSTTLHLETVDVSAVPANAYLAFEWQVTGGTYYACGIDDICVMFDPNVTLTKTIESYENSPSQKGGYYLIASPLAADVDPTNVGGMITADEVEDENAVLTYDLYSFDQSQTLEWQNYRNGAFNSLVNGQGYLYASKGGTTLTFSGAPYSGDTKTVTLHKTEAATGLDFPDWNLVGNPFALDDAYITKSFYTLENSDTYTLNTAGTAIHPMQGLLVVADEDGETMTFSTAPNSKVAKLNMNVTKGRAVVDQAIVSFTEGQQLPKLQFRNGSTKVYLPKDGKEYAIVSTEAMGTMPVNFKAENDGTYTLSFTAEEVSFAYLHLIDNLTGIETDLLATPSYSFEARTTDYESRFKLVFATGNNSNDNFAFYSNGSFVINNEGEATLQVIDMNGRILKNESINGCANVNVKAAAGVYMLRLVNGNDVKVQKVVVR